MEKLAGEVRVSRAGRSSKNAVTGKTPKSFASIVSATVCLGLHLNGSPAAADVLSCDCQECEIKAFGIVGSLHTLMLFIVL